MYKRAYLGNLAYADDGIDDHSQASGSMAAIEAAPDINMIWAATMEVISSSGSINPAAFSAWVVPLTPHSYKDGRFVLVTNNEHIKTTVGRYINKVTIALSKVCGKKTVAMVIMTQEVRDNKEPIKPEGCNLQSGYIFDNFVKGKCNEFAYEAARAVADEPGKRYNPLFLHGDVGLGKTHLMHSIGNSMFGIRPGARVIYTSSENLMNEFVSSIRGKRNQEFRDKYRNADLLLVDDVQFLLDKEGIQEEFFHTFNALHANNKQIVLTSDRPPLELKSLEDRLRSRFGSGLTVDITLPDLETRIAILEMKVEMDQMDVNADLIYFIAKSIPSNIRELEGALNTVYARAKLTNKLPTIDFAAATLDMINRESHVLDIAYIQDVISNYYNVDIAALKSQKRTKNITYARHVAMYFCRKFLDNSLKDIGRAFGGRDHSSIIHACNKVSVGIDGNKRLREEVRKLEGRISRS